MLSCRDLEVGAARFDRLPGLLLAPELRRQPPLVLLPDRRLLHQEAMAFGGLESEAGILVVRHDARDRIWRSVRCVGYVRGNTAQQ